MPESESVTGHLPLRSLIIRVSRLGGAIRVRDLVPDSRYPL